MTTQTAKLTQTAKIEFLRAQITTSALWTERAVLALYARQTADEQAAQATSHHNQMGFSGVDAEFLSRMAEWIKSSRKPAGSRLTDRQLAVTQRKIGKYARQLLAVIEESGAEAVAKLEVQMGLAHARATEAPTAAPAPTARWTQTTAPSAPRPATPADTTPDPEWDALRSAADCGVHSAPKAPRGRWAVVNQAGAPVRLVGVAQAG